MQITMDEIRQIVREENEPLRRDIIELKEAINGKDGLADKVSTLVVWRARMEGAGTGIMLTFSLLGAIIGLAISGGLAIIARFLHINKD